MRDSFKEELKLKEFRVTIFGSARIEPKDKIYKEVYKLGKALGGRRINLVNGGGPGLMNAVSEGHKLGRKRNGAHAIGLNIKLPHEQKANTSLTLVKEFARFSRRLDSFMLLSDVVVVAPGGLGTLLELFYTWQLVQVKKIRSIPIILLGEMWEGLIDWMEKEPLRRKYFDKEDLHCIFIAKNSKECIEIIEKAKQYYDRKDHKFCVDYKKYRLK